MQTQQEMPCVRRRALSLVKRCWCGDRKVHSAVIADHARYLAVRSSEQCTVSAQNRQCLDAQEYYDPFLNCAVGVALQNR